MFTRRLTIDSNLLSIVKVNPLTTKWCPHDSRVATFTRRLTIDSNLLSIVKLILLLPTGDKYSKRLFHASPAKLGLSHRSSAPVVKQVVRPLLIFPAGFNPYTNNKLIKLCVVWTPIVYKYKLMPFTITKPKPRVLLNITKPGVLLSHKTLGFVILSTKPWVTEQN